MQVSWTAAPRRRSWITTGVVLLLVLGCFRTVLRNNDWTSRETLIKYVITNLRATCFINRSKRETFLLAWNKVLALVANINNRSYIARNRIGVLQLREKWFCHAKTSWTFTASVPSSDLKQGGWHNASGIYVQELGADADCLCMGSQNITNVDMGWRGW